MSIYDCKRKKVTAKFEKDIKLNCPYLAVIPSQTVDTVSQTTGIQNALVHITDINTTVYIDDKFRQTIISVGEIEIPDYDYQNNPRKIKGQTVVDFENSRTIRYDRTGTNYIVTTGTGGTVNG